VGFVHCPLEHWITHHTVFALVVDFGSDAPLLRLSHPEFVEDLECLFDGHVAVSGWLALHALVAHDFLGGVVSESVAHFNQLDHEVFKFLKVVAGVCHFVRNDAKGSQVVLNRVKEFEFFFDGIGVVKAQDECAVVCFCRLLVDDGRLSMANVQVS